MIIFEISATHPGPLMLNFRFTDNTVRRIHYTMQYAGRVFSYDVVDYGQKI